MALKGFTSNRPQATNKFALRDHVGQLLAFTVTEVTEVDTKFGSKTAIRADVTVMTGLLKGMDYGDSLIFAASVVRDLTNEVGNVVVARVGEWDNGSNSGFELTEPSAEDLAAAAEHFLGY